MPMSESGQSKFGQFSINHGTLTMKEWINLLVIKLVQDIMVKECLNKREDNICDAVPIIQPIIDGCIKICRVYVISDGQSDIFGNR